MLCMSYPVHGFSWGEIRGEEEMFGACITDCTMGSNSYLRVNKDKLHTRIAPLARASWQFAEGGMWCLNVQPVVKAWEKNFQLHII